MIERSAQDWVGGTTGVLAPPRPRRRRRDPGDTDGPPFDRDGDDDDDHGGGGDPPDGGRGGPGGGSEPGPDGRAEFALGLFLVAIVALFTVFIATYVLSRRTSPVWPPPEAPHPPVGLWLSTGILAASSATLIAASRAVRRGSGRAGARWLALTLVSGGLFVVAQVAVWRRLSAEGLLPSSGGYGAIFFALTGLHAVHVLGGLGVLTRSWVRVVRAKRVVEEAPGVRLCGIYWHFMGALWLVLFCVLYLAHGS